LKILTDAKRIGAIKSGKARISVTVRAKSSMDRSLSFLSTDEIQGACELAALGLMEIPWLRDNAIVQLRLIRLTRRGGVIFLLHSKNR
jgi:hypothetical protein